MRPALPAATRRYTPTSRRVRLRGDSGLCGGVAVLLLAALASAPAAANPSGGAVVAGSATITTLSQGSVQVNQTTSKAVIEWQDFSIGVGEVTSFVQPSTSSITLNRVVGGNASEILGRLTANGQIWIVNPNGIFFGSTAVVDVAGLLATTHDIGNADFMAGRYNFRQSGSGGYVINEGTITVADTGLVGLVAPYVANRGIITARLGEVALASGTAFTVDFYGDQLINLALDATITSPVTDNTGKTVSSLVENSGSIFADGGRVTMTAAAAKGVVDKVIDTSGIVQAHSVLEKDGEIYLLGAGGTVEVSGALDASGVQPGTTGGAVVVTGDAVTLKGTAKVNVSGAAGGGQAMIGGDVQGGKATSETLATYGISNYRKTIANAKTTIVETGATISADATVKGDGGKIIVWADENTLSYGTLTAKGGTLGGDGGFVETSGLLGLSIGGLVDASAPLGQAGTWLLDPNDIEIVDTVSGGYNNGTYTGGTFTATATPALISDDTIETTLAAGTDVKIIASGDITVSVAIDPTLSADRTLTLSADGSITVSAPISAASASLNVSLEAGDTGTITVSDSIFTNGGTFSAGGTTGVTPTSINFSTGSQVTASGMTLSADGITINGDLSSDGDVTMTGTNIYMASIGGGVSLSSGMLRVDASYINIYDTISAPSVELSATNALYMSGAATLDITGTQTTSILRSDDLSLGGSITTTMANGNTLWLQGNTSGTTISLGSDTIVGTLNLTDSELATITNFSSLKIGTSNTGGTITVKDTSDWLVQLPTSTTLLANSVVISDFSTGTSLEVLNNGSLSIDQASGSTFSQQSNTALTANKITISAGDVTLNGDVTAASDLEVTALSSDLTIGGDLISTGGGITMKTASGGDFVHSGTINANTASKTILIQADTIDLTGTISANTSTGRITLQSATPASTTIGVAGGSGTFNLSSTELGLITADTLTIGQTTNLAVEVGAASTFTLPANVSTLELAGYSIAFTGDVLGTGQNLKLYANGGSVSFSGDIGSSSNRFGQLWIDPPSTVTVSGSAWVSQLDVIGATGTVSFASLDSSGTASISTTGALLGTYSVTGDMTVSAASTNITATIGGSANITTSGALQGVFTVSGTPTFSGGSGTYTINGSQTSISSGGGGGDGGSGGTDTTTGGTDTTTGGTDTTDGGTDTTDGGTDTTTGGTDTTDGGTTTTTTTITDVITTADIISETAAAQVVAQQIATLTSDSSSTTSSLSTTFDSGTVGTVANDPLPVLTTTVTTTPIVSTTTTTATTTTTTTTTTTVPLDDTGLPAYSSSASTTSAAVQEAIVDFTTTLSTGSATDAVAAVAATSLSNTEVRAVFDSVSAAEVVSSLTASSSTLGQQVGALLQETLNGGTVTYAEVKGVLDSHGTDGELARTYLSLFQRVQKEARSDLFASALDALRSNPDAADLFASPEEGKEAKPQFSGVRMSGMTPDGLARIEGKIQHPSPFVQLRVNGRWVFVDAAGSFQADIPVQAGANEVLLSVVDEDGDRTEHRIGVDAARATPAEAQRPREGKRVALLMATHDYKDPDIPDLVTPKADTTLVAKTLRERMGYDTRVVENGSKAAIVEALTTLGRELSETDSVVVYYAGHGFALPETGHGYWLPTDARTDSPTQWISNQDVARLLHRMPAKHILLVADSCYSGAFTREQSVTAAEVERDPNALRQRRSVMAMSSGGDEPVLDGDINSPFATAFVNQVGKLQSFESGIGVFKQVHGAVTKSTPQTPQYGAVRFAGYDPGGDYLFNRTARTRTSAAR